jgi:hypothetical protein
MEICAIFSLVDCPETIQAMIASMKGRLNRVVDLCRQKNYAHTVSYLESASDDLLTALENRLQGKTTSRVERLMRTVNIRGNISKWSTEGALNVTKVRLTMTTGLTRDRCQYGAYFAGLLLTTLPKSCLIPATHCMVYRHPNTLAHAEIRTDISPGLRLRHRARSRPARMVQLV